MTIQKFHSFSLDLEAFVWPAEDKKQRRKRERILLAATELFIQLGYRKTSIEAIAKRACLAKGTIYLYYGNKAEIVLHAIALEKLAHLRQLLENLRDDFTAEEVLRTFIVVAVVMSREMPLTASLLRGDQEIAFAMQDVDERLQLRLGKMRIDAVSNLIDDATHHELTKPRLKMLSHTLVDLLNSVFLSQHTLGTGISPIKYAHNLADMLVGGLVNANKHQASDALQSLYKKLSKSKA